MAIFDMFFWWYSDGWKIFISKVKGALEGLVDFFSMDSLIRTLFKPFRQISASATTTDVALDAKFQMFVDRLISRAIGFFSRLILLVVGLVLIVFGGMASLAVIIIWPLVPLFPIIGAILTIVGYSL